MSQDSFLSYKKILVIRRDNIGDLLCTTPLLRGLRERFPPGRAKIDLLVSSYNAPLVENNPFIDDLFIFPKKQHLQEKPHKNSLFLYLRILWKRHRIASQIRKNRYDHIILANGGWRYARFLGGKEMIGFREVQQPKHRQPHRVIPLHQPNKKHEVIKMSHLGAALDATETLGPLYLKPRSELVTKISQQLITKGWDPHQPTLACHISSRKPSQRWPATSFLQLFERLQTVKNLQLLLLWSPGSFYHPLHPGDDQKAAFLLQKTTYSKIWGAPTKTLPELVASLSLVDQMLCSDGGAMHVAAALQKPLVALFGDSNYQEWHPWKVPHLFLQHPNRNVTSITPEEVIKKLQELQTLLVSESEQVYKRFTF